MKIELLFFGQLRALTNVPGASVAIKDGSRLEDLVEHLSREYGEKFRHQVSDIQGLRILINGREYRLLGGMEAPLHDKDTVVFLPPVAGG